MWGLFAGMFKSLLEVIVDALFRQYSGPAVKSVEDAPSVLDHIEPVRTPDVVDRWGDLLRGGKD